MRKKLDTRFPAPRIKKIMQADEDVGKIALAVPVLVSKALELFLQDLCDRTYNVTVQRGVKTVSSSHLRKCIYDYNVYDFLREVVSKVPDLGDGGGATGADDRHGKRRKAAEEDDSEEESKRTRNEHPTGRGRGRGRRGRRGGRVAERETVHYDKYDEDFEISPRQISKPANLKFENADEASGVVEMKEAVVSNPAAANPAKIDLNVGFEENGSIAAAPAPAPAVSSAAATAGPSTSEPNNNEAKPDEYPGWQLPEMNKMAIDPVQFALSNQRFDEAEDYDEEG